MLADSVRNYSIKTHLNQNKPRDKNNPNNRGVRGYGHMTLTNADPRARLT